MLKKGLSSRIRFHEKMDKVVLLVPGFRATPKIFDNVADALYEKGYSIYSLRLPGHCCVDDDEVLSTKLEDWQAVVDNVFLDLCDMFDEVYLCGLSLGAALLINCAYKYGFKGKIAAYSPMFKLKEKAALLTGIAGNFVKKLPPKKPDCSIESDAFDGFVPFFSLPQVYEIYRLTKKLKKRLPHVKAQILCFLAHNDHILDFTQHKELLSRYKTFKIVELEKSYHNCTVDVEKDYVIEKTLEWFNEKI